MTPGSDSFDGLKDAVMRKMLYWGGALAGMISLGAFLWEQAFRLARYRIYVTTRRDGCDF